MRFLASVFYLISLQLKKSISNFGISRKCQFSALKTIKPFIFCFLYNKKRGKWPFSNMVMRGLFLSKKIFLIKAGFLAQKHGDSEGVFSDRIFLKKFRGFLPIFRLYMRGFKKIPKIPGHFAFFKRIDEEGNLS